MSNTERIATAGAQMERIRISGIINEMIFYGNYSGPVLEALVDLYAKIQKPTG